MAAGAAALLLAAGFFLAQEVGPRDAFAPVPLVVVGTGRAVFAVDESGRPVPVLEALVRELESAGYYAFRAWTFSSKGRRVALVARREPREGVFEETLLVAATDGPPHGVTALRTDMPLVPRVALSPDGERVACRVGDGLLVLGPRGESLAEVKTGWFGGLAFSPDGSRIAFDDDRAIRVFDIASGTHAPAELPGTGREIACVLSWQEDGRIAYRIGERSVYAAAVGSKADAAFHLPEDAGAPCLSRSGDAVAFSVPVPAAGGDRMDVRLLRDGRETTLLPRVHGAIDGITWVDGTRFRPEEPGKLSGTVAVVALEHDLRGWEGDIRQIAIAPDGLRYACGLDNGAVLISTVEAGAKARLVARHESDVVGLAFSPDGARLVSASIGGKVVITETADGRAVGGWDVHDSISSNCLFDAAGEVVALALEDGTLTTWSALDGKSLAAVRAHKGAAGCLAWASDGKRLLSGGEDGAIRAWDPTGRWSATPLAELGDGVLSLAIDAKRGLVAPRRHRGAHRPRAAQNRARGRRAPAPPATSAPLAFLRTTDTLASAARDGTVRISSAGSLEGRAARSIPAVRLDALSAFPDGRRFAVGGTSGILYVFDAAPGR